MPFVVSPINPSKDFEKDAVDHSQSKIEEFKKSYILEHYKDAREVFKNIQIIASNRTVEFYIKNYFKDSHVWLQEPMILKKESVERKHVNTKYDFIYMARMESGKGVEYLEDILGNISLLINRPIKVPVVGRIDDSFSKQALDKLIQRFRLNKLVSLEYIQWINENEKRDFFLKSSVFIYPSILDNFPTVVNEALSYGLPVVVWDVPFSYINYSDINAVLRTPLFDFKLFAENSIKALIERDKLSKDAYQYIDSFTTPENSIEKDFILLKEIVRYNHE
jgi:glycosyltransferase involved in cell wall biosynthesis